MTIMQPSHQPPVAHSHGCLQVICSDSCSSFTFPTLGGPNSNDGNKYNNQGVQV